MKTVALISVFLFIMANTASAQDTLPAEVQEAKHKYLKMIDGNSLGAKESLEKLKVSFLKRLEKEMTKAQKAGKLQDTLTLQMRIDAVKSASDLGLLKSDPGYSSYKKKLDEISEDKKKADIKDTKSYASYLKKKVASSTKAGNLQLAVAFDKELTFAKGILEQLDTKDEPTLPQDPMDDVAVFFRFNRNDIKNGKIRNVAPNGAEIECTVKGAVYDVRNKGLSFNGKSYLTIPNHESVDFKVADDFTISFWVKPEGEGRASVIEKWAGGYTHYPFVARLEQGPTIGFNQYHGGSRSDGLGGPKLDIRRYTHCLYVKKGNEQFIYINSKLAVKATKKFTNEYRNTQPYYIGRRGGSPAYFFRGSIDDIAMWKRALSEDDIKAIYERGH